MNTEDMKSHAYSDADEMGCRGMVTQFLQAGMSAQKVHELFRDAKTNKFKSKKQIRQYLGGALRNWKMECGLDDPVERIIEKPANVYLVGKPVRRGPEPGTPEYEEETARILERIKSPKRRVIYKPEEAAE